ncbi:MAG: NifB/NifX family molybdenum-iron cluster-binding protein [Spirochaeta sp.]
MPRPVQHRRIRPCSARHSVFKPAGTPMHMLAQSVLTADQAEAIRLADLDGLYHSAAARRMDVSRQTFSRILADARRCVADAIMNHKALRIEGGTITIQETTMHTKIALPSRNGIIDAHFGHCDAFSLFEITEGKISGERLVPSPNGCGCKSNIAADLAAAGVTLMIAGNMGEGAVRTLNSHGIDVLRGASGSTREAVEAWLTDTLKDSGENCSSHDHACSH